MKIFVVTIAKRSINFFLNYFGYQIIRTIQAKDADQPIHSESDREPLSQPFDTPLLAGAALQQLVERFEFETVLDVGAGGLEHSIILAQKGKKVTAVDFGTSIYAANAEPLIRDSISFVTGDFLKVSFQRKFDCIWASHVLEHQTDVDAFLRKAISLLNESGILAITVPPLKHEIVGGHVSLWNAGLLLYRLVLAGLDCREASVRTTGYNVTVIVRKKMRPPVNDLHMDCGDIRKIRNFLPKELSFYPNKDDDPFDGNISRLNWSTPN